MLNWSKKTIAKMLINRKDLQINGGGGGGGLIK
jgi:hypothetical protein